MMDLLSASAIKACTSLIKNIVDDLYNYSKNEIKVALQTSRASLSDRKIARLVAASTRVKTLWNIEKEISLYNFYYPSQIETLDGAPKKISSLKDLGFQNYVFQGTAGQGKSIFLRYLCGQELQKNYSTNRLPIFLELRRVHSSGTLNKLLLASLEKFGLEGSDNVLDHLFQSKKVILMLDGFDEIEPSLVTATLDEIESLAQRYNESLQILVTSRPDSGIQNSNQFRVGRLVPLKPSDHLPFLKKVCDDKEQYLNLHNVINKSKTEVKDLLTTPLMMTLLVMLYKTLQTVPESVPKFYEELFDVLFYRHDHSKPGFRRKRFTTLDDGVIKKLFAAFCFYVRLRSYVVLNMETFEECFSLAAKSIGVTVDTKQFKDEIVKTVCLMQEEGFEISFIHKSVMEYYAASFVKKSSEDFARKFYSKMLDHYNQTSWKLELTFLSQIDEYRYSQYFVLPTFVSFEKEFAINFDNNFSENDFDKLMKVIQDDCQFKFKKLEDGSYMTWGWRRGLHVNPWIDLFRETWLNRVMADKRNQDLTILEKASKLKRETIYDEEDIFTADCSVYMNTKTKDDQIKFIEITYNHIKKIKETARSIVDLERLKASMFDDLLPI